MDTIQSRILLVEDDLDLADLYKMRLEMEGFTVKHCANGEDALQTVSEFDPHLVLLDIMMPKLDGFNVIDILRNTPDTRAVKIIVLSALGQPSDRERAKALGANDYLVKSQVLLTDVMAIIRQHLNLPPAPVVAKPAT